MYETASKKNGEPSKPSEQTQRGQMKESPMKESVYVASYLEALAQTQVAASLSLSSTVVKSEQISSLTIKMLSSPVCYNLATKVTPEKSNLTKWLSG